MGTVFNMEGMVLIDGTSRPQGTILVEASYVVLTNMASGKYGEIISWSAIKTIKLKG